MLDGRLAGRGTPEEFYTRPPTLAAARFFGGTNELHGLAADGGVLRDPAGVGRASAPRARGPTPPRRADRARCV